MTENERGNTFQVTLTFETSNKPRASKSFTVSREQVHRYDLRRWKTVTLMTHPADEMNIVPYFVTDAYTVGGQGRAASSPPQQNAQPRALFTASPGVEPELYCLSPRRAAWERGANSLRSILINLFVGSSLVLLYLIRQTPAAFTDYAGSIFFSVLVFLVGYGVWERNLWRNRFFLQQGYAARAKVTRCTRESEFSEVNIRFEYPNNLTGNAPDTAHGYLTLSPYRAEQLGGMEAGTMFTVLRHPTESYTLIPYFNISGVEVYGGNKVQVTTPAPSIP
ncbi:MAG: hypothetical protein EON58_22880 [Alphaproteobacteria bacterium]|nr:MAG: hypothetical protein EON58_22880 [Alphaproteobacteria bacterium]